MLSCYGKWNLEIRDCQMCINRSPKLASDCKKKSEEDISMATPTLVRKPIVKSVSAPAVASRVIKRTAPPAPAPAKKAAPIAKSVPVKKAAPAVKTAWVDDCSTWREDSHKGYTRALIQDGYSHQQIVNALVKEFWSDRPEAEKLANRYITYVSRKCGIAVKVGKPAPVAKKSAPAVAPAKVIRRAK